MSISLSGQRWEDHEDATLRRMAAAGAPLREIVAALPGRNSNAVNRRRRALGCAPGHRTPHGEAAPHKQRIAALEATVAAALRERRVDWDYVDELLSGLEWLRARAQ